MKRYSSAFWLFIFSVFLAVTLSCNKKEPLPQKKEDPITTPPSENPPPVENPPPTTPTTVPAINIPGTSYKINVSSGSSSHLAVEYIAGDHASKLILTAPHGGDQTPSYVRNRTSSFSYAGFPTDPYSTDNSFSSTTDSRTRDYAKAIAESVRVKTGLRPHLVIVHLQRGKLDANRRMAVAAQGDKNAEKAWEAFHGFIDSAKKTVTHFHPSGGLLIDVHGNGHTPQRTEVGYLLSSSDFTNYKNALSTAALVNKSSIKAMVNSSASMTDLIKGDYALGTLINQKTNPVVIATPSKAYPEPGNKSIFTDGLYFNGGYITSRHGSRYGGVISAIQLEFNGSVRTVAAIPTSSQQIAEAIKIYMDKYFK